MIHCPKTLRIALIAAATFASGTASAEKYYARKTLPGLETSASSEPKQKVCRELKAGVALDEGTYLNTYDALTYPHGTSVAAMTPATLALCNKYKDVDACQMIVYDFGPGRSMLVQMMPIKGAVFEGGSAQGPVIFYGGACTP